MKFTTPLLLFVLSFLSQDVIAQHSVARGWNEVLLEAIRDDQARPTVHARNLFHSSVGMYDAWAAYDSVAQTYLLGNVLNGYDCPFDTIILVGSLEEAREEAISYAAYRILLQRFAPSVGADTTLPNIHNHMIGLGYDTSFTGTDFSNGNPAAFGNYIAHHVIQYGLNDNSNEVNDYANQYYEETNLPLVPDNPGNPDIEDPNRWQTLQLDVFIDQSGEVLDGDSIAFLGPEWGNVHPFCLSEEDRTSVTRDSTDWNIYLDPGAPPYIDLTDTLSSEYYKWGFSMVSIWSSHLTPVDTTMWDISPASLGNIDSFPTSLSDYPNFYNYIDGGDSGEGYSINPVTGEPYEAQIVKRGDYARVVAEFWADGPDSETPPGHWFTLLNYVSDHPLLEKRFRNLGPELDDLEWDVKAYLIMGGAMHDAAVTAWGNKGYYDYIRPVSALRFMGDQGQSTNEDSLSYDFFGLPIVPGYIETVKMGDPLQGSIGQHIGKMKGKVWRGPDFIGNPDISHAGVTWIRMERWWPYQRPTFVTPPFAGYVSGHSTFSRAAAEVLTELTGDMYFPGGLGEYYAEKDEFLVFENGPSEDVTLQWATYYDAANESALSRIWGGIHPPADDIPGRIMGIKIGKTAFAKGESMFLIDADNDGFYSIEDCDDNNPDVYPGGPEICDNLDNDCDQLVDDSITYWTYYVDLDLDGFGTEDSTLYTCENVVPTGFSSNADDCDDSNEFINPDAMEVCDTIDNNCNQLVDEDLEFFNYFYDGDNDGYGSIDSFIQSCDTILPEGYSVDFGDCDDTDDQMSPGLIEVCDSLDNDCNGDIDDELVMNTLYADSDGDGYGDTLVTLLSCFDSLPGYVANSDDCDDTDENINPDAEEIPDNMVDENCDGSVFYTAVEYVFDDQEVVLFPNPSSGVFNLRFNFNGDFDLKVYDQTGALVKEIQVTNHLEVTEVDLSGQPQGAYLLRAESEGEALWVKEFQIN